MEVRNTAELRNNNIKRIINYLRKNTPITKKELSGKLELSFATVSNLSNELVEIGILLNSSAKSSSGGRIPELLEISENAKHIVCVTLSNINAVEIAVLNLKEITVAMSVIDMSEATALKDMINMIYSETCKLCAKRGIAYDTIIGVGVAILGIYNRINGNVINSTYELFENQPIKKIFEDVFGLPTYIENVSNLLAIASMNHESSDEKPTDLVYLYDADGLGVGIISNGQLVKGITGLAGEISHIPIGNRDFECYCGQKGCVETELNQKGILKKYRIISESYEPISWQYFVERAYENEPYAMGVIKETGCLLGKLCSIIINFTDPGSVYVGGILSDIFDLIYPYALDEIRKRMTKNSDCDIYPIHSDECKKMILRGCADMIIERWQPKISV